MRGDDSTHDAISWKYFLRTRIKFLEDKTRPLNMKKKKVGLGKTLKDAARSQREQKSSHPQKFKKGRGGKL